jgi:hypothetical protein
VRLNPALLLALACLLSNSLTVQAQVSEQVEIDWSAPEGCPRPAALEAEIARRLGREANRLEQAEISVSVAERAGGYVLALEVEGPQGEFQREVELRDCAEVERAAVVLISTALAPELEHEEEAAEPVREPRETRPWALRAEALFDGFSLPKPSFGVGLGVSHAFARGSAWAVARYVARATADEGTVPVGVQLFGGALGGAYLKRFSALAVGPMAELELGALHARAEGERANGSVTHPWASFWLGALLDYEFGSRVGVDIALLLGLVPRPPRFRVEDSDAYETPVVTARARIGLRVLLGPKKLLGGGQ